MSDTRAPCYWQHYIDRKLALRGLRGNVGALISPDTLRHVYQMRDIHIAQKCGGCR